MAALQGPGLRKGDRVATLWWNHHTHLECNFGIPAADARDRFVVVDDVLLPLYGKFASAHPFEKVFVFPSAGAPLPAGFADHERLLEGADPDAFEYVAHDEQVPVAMCYPSGKTGRPEAVVYSHRSTILHTLAASLGDCWDLENADCVLPVTPMFQRQQLEHPARGGDDGGPDWSCRGRTSIRRTCST